MLAGEIRSSGTRPADIVVLDDDPAFRGALAAHLSRDGMTVRACDSLAAARAALVERAPDILVTALTLSGGSAAPLIEALRDLPGGESAVVAVVSSGAGFLDKVDAITSGADFFAEKPVDLDAFLVRLRSALKRAGGEPPRILSVDDDPDQNLVLRAILEPAGYEVQALGDPARLESEVITFRPDLILMDVNLPRVSGYDLVRYLRHEERFATLPVVFLTVERREQERIAALRAGGDDHLVKPVAPALLLSTVAARLERARFLKSLLVRDGLTGLLTHTAFLERARSVASTAQRTPSRPIALVVIDLDHFKAVNDTWGHPVGDRVLASLGVLLRRRLRASDTIGRLGGEEFALLLEDLGAPDAVRLVERLREEFSTLRHRSAEGRIFHVDFSAGVSLFEPGRMTLEAWRNAADEALYSAKASGRGRVVLAEGRTAPVPSPQGPAARTP
jgi:diguanylate cyclase (GGDEF)-like protein